MLTQAIRNKKEPDIAAPTIPPIEPTARISGYDARQFGRTVEFIVYVDADIRPKRTSGMRHT